MQNDFLLPDAPVPAPGGLELVPIIADLTRRARQVGAPVVFTQEAHRPGRQDFGIERFFEPIHCVEGGTGIEITDGLAPEPPDLVIGAKRRYDAFLGTELDLVLRDATAGTSPQRHEAALLCLEHVFARIETAEAACKIVGWPEIRSPQ